MTTLPTGWIWVDPKDTAYPWRAESRSGSKDGLALSIEGDRRERVVDAAAKIDAGFAAVVAPGQGWVPSSGGFIP
jgi:hypothetical protein